MVLTEAFASSTPVVASRIAGYRDVVRSRQDGLLVPPGDAVELGEALRDLALDPERRHAWRARPASARSASPGRRWPREVTEVYEEAIAQPQPRPRGARSPPRRRCGRRARPARAPAPAAVARAEGAARAAGAGPRAWLAAAPWWAARWRASA